MQVTEESAESIRGRLRTAEQAAMDLKPKIRRADDLRTELKSLDEAISAAEHAAELAVVGKPRGVVSLNDPTIGVRATIGQLEGRRSEIERQLEECRGAGRTQIDADRLKLELESAKERDKRVAGGILSKFFGGRLGQSQLWPMAVSGADSDFLQLRCQLDSPGALAATAKSLDAAHATRWPSDQKTIAAWIEQNSVIRAGIRRVLVTYADGRAESSAIYRVIKHFDPQRQAWQWRADGFARCLFIPYPPAAVAGALRRAKVICENGPMLADKTMAIGPDGRLVHVVEPSAENLD